MSSQRHINSHAGTHVIAQHFNDFTDGFSATGRALGEFNHHHKPHACAHDLFWRDQDVEAQTAVIWHHKADARIGKVAADNLAGFWHQNTHNARFTTAFTVSTQRLSQNLIAVDTHFHLFAGEVQIVFAALYAQEAIAIAVADNRSFEQIKAFWQGVTLTAGKDQLPVTLHGAQATAQCFVLLFAFDIEFNRQLFTAGRFFAFC